MTDRPNDTEKDFWSGPSGTSWVTFEDEQETYLREVAELVIDRAAPQPGERVLDIGSGTGGVSLMAAERVGDAGHVLATDISEPLLTRAAERSAAYPQMSTLLADSQTVDWPDTGFDLAVSRFGVMFFADPPAAFANIARALKPGARIVFAAWASAAENPYWHIPQRHAVARLGQPPKVAPDGPGPMGLATMELALERLRAGGLSDVQGEAVDLHLNHPGGVEAAADLATRIGAATRIINMFGGTADDKAAIRDAITEDFAQFATPNGAAVPARINLLTARAT